MANTQKPKVTATSGAPENPTDNPVTVQTEGIPQDAPIIWDRNNVLVHPELDAALRTETDQILGNSDNPDVIGRDPNYVPPKPEETQSLDGQTSEPLTNPQPSNDPRTAPSLAAKPADAQEVGNLPPERLPQYAPTSGGSEREAGKQEQEGVVGAASNQSPDKVAGDETPEAAPPNPNP